MRIIDLLEPGRVVADLKAATKRAVLEELVATLAPGPEKLDRNAVVEVLLERERLGSTGIGDYIAIPHGKLPSLPAMKLAFGRSLKGVDFDSMDGKPSHLFFLLLAPENSAGIHLKVLAKISRMLLSHSFREALLHAATAQDIFRLLADRDAEQ
jgi:PTS system nitrogen regulatory IIA component